MNPKKVLPLRQLQADVVVAGGGGAGLAAAVAAAESGAKVVVLERRCAPGGNSNMAEGLFAAESPVQRRLGIDARKDELFRMAMEYAHWSLNARVLRAFIDKSGDTISWLEAKGLRFASIPPMYPRQTIRTWHSPEKGGVAVISTLYNACLDLGVKIIYNAPAQKILLDRAGKVRGILAVTGHSKIEIIARSVIIATGGFAGNKEMLKKNFHYPVHTVISRGLPHMGEGISMAVDIGASTETLNVAQLTAPYFPNSPMLTDVTREPNSVWVNKRGERFTDEFTACLPSESVNSIMRQPEMAGYALVDSDLVRGISRDGFTKVYLGVLYGQDVGGVQGLDEEFERQARGLATIEQISTDKCSGCDACVTSCPEMVITLDTNTEEFSSCRFTCPADVDIRTYFYLLRTGRIDEAVKTLREYLPLPAVTGRVCPHLCETECARKEVDEAVNINAIERFVADYSLNEKAKPVARKYKKKVAIVGSGPAGLSAAYFLTRQGYPVTVFEQQKELGGMLRMGIPEYRLPRKVLDSQIKYIADMGAELKTGVAIGKDITIDKLQKDYQAVFFATGNQLSRKIELDGSKKAGVLWGLDFLKEANLKGNVKVGNRVVVIGGGNVAVDVALTALRLGAKEVQVACLEKGKEIPAYKEEIEQAKSEGVKINEGWGPNKILGTGKVTGIELIKCTSVFDKAGKFNPAYDKKTIKTIEADMVILAVGQSPDFSLAPKAMELYGNAVKADAITLETSIDGVFAGGDIVNPAGSVIQAIAAGKRAAHSIDRYLKGEDLKKGRTAKAKRVQKPPKEGMPLIARNNTPVKAVSKVAGNFNEVKPGFDEDTANLEANRCMTCGSKAIIDNADKCRLCKTCEHSCPTKAIYHASIKKIEPRVKVANSWSEIAAWIGCDAKTLKATIAQYNRCCDHGHDYLFTKDRRFLRPLRTPPFYALRFIPSLIVTMGGIRINEHMEAVGSGDKPCPGLFAAGCDTGGWESETYCVLLSGSTFGFAINSGRIAGENAAKYAQKIKTT